MYSRADVVVFTMEGGCDYIVEKGCDKARGDPIALDKLYHINNGVDLEEFDYNREHNAFPDPDLDDTGSFKVVQTGSIRKVNQVELLAEVAECLKAEWHKERELLIWGDGDYRETIEESIRKKG